MAQTERMANEALYAQHGYENMPLRASINFRNLGDVAGRPIEDRNWRHEHQTVTQEAIDALHEELGLRDALNSCDEDDENSLWRVLSDPAYLAVNYEFRLRL
jgi:hypothetical protein